MRDAVLEALTTPGRGGDVRLPIALHPARSPRPRATHCAHSPSACFEAAGGAPTALRASSRSCERSTNGRPAAACVRRSAATSRSRAAW